VPKESRKIWDHSNLLEGISVKEIPLTQGKVTLVDDEDFDYLNQFKWYARKSKKTFYAFRGVNINKKVIGFSLHRSIMNPPVNMEIDHINGNGLDNQKENMRIVTSRQNAQNRHIKKSSHYVGVSWDTKSKKWFARIRVRGISRYLGSFKNEIDAAAMYRVTCAVLFPQSP
jgi:hypothetical protein